MSDRIRALLRATMAMSNQSIGDGFRHPTVSTLFGSAPLEADTIAPAWSNPYTAEHSDFAQPSPEQEGQRDMYARGVAAMNFRPIVHGDYRATMPIPGGKRRPMTPDEVRVRNNSDYAEQEQEAVAAARRRDEAVRMQRRHSADMKDAWRETTASHTAEPKKTWEQHKADQAGVRYSWQ
jgi:hypothetical protein